ncbi:MAG: hypothetical protein K0R27_803 [Xanthobacteraceae bacterium]|nr:hypothetical protein [Xanthobacteraceae bacterium]
MDDKPAPAMRLPRDALHGDQIIARSVRFMFTVMGPIVAGLVVGIGPWLIFALVTAILGFALDPGGRPGPRLAWFAGAGLVIVLGTGLGTLLIGQAVLIMLSFAVAGAMYALVESLSDRAAMAARFLCFTLAIGGLYMPLGGLEAAVVALTALYAWSVSLAWDLAIGVMRPYTAPNLGEIVRKLRATMRERWIFAGAVAIAVPLAYLTSIGAGLPRPYWTMIIIVIVLRADALSSGRLILEMMAGTALGVACALGYGLIVAQTSLGHWGLLAGMLVAALLRWPAQELHGALGMAVLTAFIILLLELIAGSVGRAEADMQARLIDVAVGCGFAMVALGLDRIGRRIF